MTVNASRLFIIASIVCFAIALIVSLGAVGSDEQAWVDGGLLSLALSFAIP